MTDPDRLLPPAPTLIGTITPSANTVVERTTQAMLRHLPAVGALFSRIPVHGSRDPFPDGYDIEGMLSAATLLAHARPAAIVWNGSKGGLIGLRHDRDLIARIEAATGIAAATSALALLRVLAWLNVARVALVTPYRALAQQRIVATLAGEGIEVVAESHLNMTDNLSFASVPAWRIREQVTAVTKTGKAQAVLAWCTNYPAAPLAEWTEAACGVPLIDATALGVWAGLRAAGVPAAPAGWGGWLKVP
jgi:maleate isomerase